MKQAPFLPRSARNWKRLLMAGLPLAVLACGMGRPSPSSAPPANGGGMAVPAERILPPNRLEGGFFQFNPQMMAVPPDQWRAILQRMHDEAKMQTVIVQALAVPPAAITSTQGPFPANDTKFYRLANPTRDSGPIEAILSSADGLGMDVYLGLWDNRGTFTWAQVNDGFLDEVADKYIQIARETWPLYRKHASFKGWYLPLEVWNIYPDPNKIESLNRFYRRVTTRLQEEVFNPATADPTLPNERELLREKMIAISPYFVPKTDAMHDWLSYAGEVADIFDVILEDAGIEVFMLQDGVGERQISIPQVRAYASEFERACRTHHIAFWLNVENFEWAAGTRIPATTAQRLMEQVAAAPAGTSKIVTFDFYHYMNPVTPDGLGALGALDRRQALYTDYLRTFRP